MIKASLSLGNFCQREKGGNWREQVFEIGVKIVKTMNEPETVF